MSKDNWAAALFTGAIAVVVGFSILLQAPNPTTATHDWEIGLGTLGAALLLIVLALVVGLVRDHPRLRFENANTRSHPITVDMTTQRAFTSAPPQVFINGVPESVESSLTTKKLPFDIAFLSVCNDPGRRMGVRSVDKVTLRLRFWRPGESNLPRIPLVRWSDLDQGEPFETTGRPHERDLAANGASHEFDVAGKFPEGNGCYALDAQSRLLGYERMPLGTPPVYVQAIARGVTAKRVEVWVLTHDGPGGSLHLDPLRRGRVSRWRLRWRLHRSLGSPWV